jgi:hypothetical protein
MDDIKPGREAFYFGNGDRIYHNNMMCPTVAYYLRELRMEYRIGTGGRPRCHWCQVH